MASGTAPPSQKARTIGFRLDGPGGAPVTMDLLIRPEELNVTEPSRVTVQQTLGGAWADCFDRGVADIHLSGTLGWRGSDGGLSGEAAFAQLRNTVVLEFHKRRAAAIAAKQDPATVVLTFVDTLDGYTFSVVPTMFSLHRSHARPLLMPYHLQLAVLGEASAPASVLDSVSSALSNPLRWVAGVTGMQDIAGSLDKLTGGSALTGALASVTGLTNAAGGVTGSLTGAVSGLASGSDGLSLSGILSGLKSGISGAVGFVTTAEGYVSRGLNIYGQVTGTVRNFVNTASNLYKRVATLGSANGGNFVGSLSSLLSTSRAISQAGANAFSVLTSAPSTAIDLGTRLAALFRGADCTMANAFGSGLNFTSFNSLLGASNCSSTGGGGPANTVPGAGALPAYAPAESSAVKVTPAAQASLTALLSADPLALQGQDTAVAAHLAAIAGGIEVAQ